jgi:cullin 2
MSLRPREIYFEDSWHSLLEIIRGVVTVNRLRKIDKPLWHNTFSDVYMLCVAHPEPHSKQLYDETKKLLESHISEIYQVSRFYIFDIIILIENFIFFFYLRL